MTIKHRRGGHLPMEASDDLLARCGGVPGVLIAGAMERADYVLQSTARPYYRVDGGVTVRFVWRHRKTNASLVFSTVLTIDHYLNGVP